MDCEEKKEDIVLLLNDKLLAAAKVAVEHGLTEATEIPGYPGMVVTLGDDQTVQVLTFFTVNGTRYAVGSRRVK